MGAEAGERAVGFEVSHSHWFVCVCSGERP